MKKQILCILFGLTALAYSSPVITQSSTSGEILGIPYDFECLGDLLTTPPFSPSTFKTIQLCIVDSLWRYGVNPFVKPWVKKHSDEIYSYLAYGQSQMGQPFPHTADQLYTEGMNVIKS